MLVRNTNQDAVQTKQILPVRWSTFIGPLVAALIAGAGAFVGMQREMSVVTNSVNRMTSTIDKLADKQTTFFESFYVPLALKVEQQGSSITSINTSLNSLRDEMRYLHPTKGYSSSERR